MWSRMWCDVEWAELWWGGPETESWSWKMDGAVHAPGGCVGIQVEAHARCHVGLLLSPLTTVLSWASFKACPAGHKHAHCTQASQWMNQDSGIQDCYSYLLEHHICSWFDWWNQTGNSNIWWSCLVTLETRQWMKWPAGDPKLNWLSPSIMSWG